MPSLPAFRENHNLFKFSSGLLLLLQWTDHRCPHCRTVFRRTYFPDVVFLGYEERTCSRCGNVFADGSREWPDLRQGQKIRYLVPPVIAGLAAGVVLCGVLTLLLMPRTVGNWATVPTVLVVLLGIFALSAIVLWAIHLLAIRSSISRYKAGIAVTRRRFEAGGR